MKKILIKLLALTAAVAIALSANVIAVNTPNDGSAPFKSISDEDLSHLTFRLYGKLPDGIEFDSATGAFSGKPVNAGQSMVSVVAQDDRNSGGAAGAEVKFDIAQYTMRGVWVSFLEMEAWIFRNGWGNKEYPQATIKRNLDEVVNTMAANNLNTLFFHVRSHQDAVYPSDIFPKSRVYDSFPTTGEGWTPVDGNPNRGAGKQGAVGKSNWSWDPLRYVIDKAHAKGIEVHAWINPYRVTVGSSVAAADGNDSYMMQSLDDSNQAKKWILEGSDNAVQWVNGNNAGIALNPARPEARQYVLDGIEEVLDGYPDIDGIHFDDYFYPTTNSAFDSKAFGETGLSSGQRANWRRGNVDTLVKATYNLIKEHDPNIQFSISPAGNNGYNYDTMYCNVSKWLREPGYADIIIPQCYWGYDINVANNKTNPDTGETTPTIWNGAAFDEQLPYWTNFLEKHESVKLVIGIGAYQLGSTGYAEWNNTRGALYQSPKRGEVILEPLMGRMVNDIFADPGRYGFVIFDYDSLFKGNTRRAGTPGYVASSTTMTSIINAELASLRAAIAGK